MNKKVAIILFSAISILLIAFFAYKDVIYQEGDPLPVIKGIVQLNSKSYAIIKDNPLKFITKANDKSELFSFIEKENNVKFTDQMGAGYIFDGPDKNVILISKQYTRFYQVWKYTETKKGSSESNWLIDDGVSGNYENVNSFLYINDEYGFIFSLPESWKNFSTVDSQWNGLPIDSPDPEKNKISGPIINIRHPKWTKENMRQDIPIMIFTNEQWQLIEDEKLILGAAPIPPSELGRNKSYIFALPARYNYAFLEGFEEVEKILNNKPLLTFDTSN